MIVATHQPDLLPYSGVFYKLAKADLFDVKVYDQFVDRGYQRRVKMRDAWASIPVHKSSSRAPINEIRIDPVEAPDALIKLIQGRYQGSPHFKTVFPVLADMITDIRTNRLWQFNLELFLGVRDLLGIQTPVSIAVPTVGGGSVGLVSVLQRCYQNGTPLTYLSGTGAKVYMGDCQEFTDAGIDVVFSNHDALTGDSIVSVLMDHEDPLSVVLREKE